MINKAINIIDNLRKNNYTFTVVSLRSAIVILVKSSSEDSFLEFYYNNSKEPYKKEDSSNLDLKAEFKEGKYETEVENYIVNNLLVGGCKSIKSYKGLEVVPYSTNILDNNILNNNKNAGSCTGNIDGDGTSYDYNDINKSFKNLENVHFDKN